MIIVNVVNVVYSIDVNADCTCRKVESAIDMYRLELVVLVLYVGWKQLNDFQLLALKC